MLINLITLKQNELSCGKNQKRNDTVGKYCCSFYQRKWLITLMCNNFLTSIKKKINLIFKTGKNTDSSQKRMTTLDE